MKPSLRAKLEGLVERHEELERLLSDPAVIGDHARFRDLSREFSQLEPLTRAYRDWQKTREDLQAAGEMAQDPDPAMRGLGEEELQRAGRRSDELEHQLQRLLLPRDRFDDSNVFLEIRAGTGGDEAALFAGDLLRMYARYAEKQGWTLEIVSESAGEHGGYKEVIARISGRSVYACLKFESGAHRVQRVPVTESQGRIHTSACTVAVLPEAEEVAEIELNPADLRIDTYRASGAGGQHVNKTDSAVRVTHLPTGLVVECQDERSQHKNRARALSLLKARLVDAERERRARERDDTRRSLVGTGDRSERIRTYNFPQGRVTDHRINLTLYKLEEIMQGNLEPVIDALAQEHQAEQLAELAGEGAR